MNAFSYFHISLVMITVVLCQEAFFSTAQENVYTEKFFHFNRAYCINWLHVCSQQKQYNCKTCRLHKNDYSSSKSVYNTRTSRM